MNTIARVTELANKRALTLFNLCTLCNIPYNTLKTAKERKSQLSVDTIEKICLGLDISMSEFFAVESAHQ